MKNSKVLIAVLAVLAAASAAKAGEMKVDFDGGSSGTQRFPVMGERSNDGPLVPISQPSAIDPDQQSMPQCGEMQIMPWPYTCTETPHMPPNCEQAGDGGWWWMTVCGDQLPEMPVPSLQDYRQAAVKEGGAMLEARGALSNFILSYADAHPEFVASVLPVFGDRNAKIFYDKIGGAYLVSGKTVLRLDLFELGRLSEGTGRRDKIAPAIEAALIVAETVHTWYNVHESWNEYHSSDNDSGASAGSGSHGGNISHQAEYNVQHNIQRGS